MGVLRCQKYSVGGNSLSEKSAFHLRSLWWVLVTFNIGQLYRKEKHRAKLIAHLGRAIRDNLHESRTTGSCIIRETVDQRSMPTQQREMETCLSWSWEWVLSKQIPCRPLSAKPNVFIFKWLLRKIFKLSRGAHLNISKFPWSSQ